MNRFTSVFRKTDGFEFFSMGGRTLHEEVDLAQQMASKSSVFKEHRYSRPVKQVCIRLGERYQFKPYQNRLLYRSLQEDLQAPFDYFPFRGGHQNECVLIVDTADVMQGLGLLAEARAGFVLEGVQTFKFRDFCKEMDFEVKPCPGEARLLGFRRNSGTASVSIPMRPALL